jgi:hypothetical protein
VCGPRNTQGIPAARGEGQPVSGWKVRPGGRGCSGIAGRADTGSGAWGCIQLHGVPLLLKIFNGESYIQGEIESGAGEEAADETGPVLHGS